MKVVKAIDRARKLLDDVSKTTWTTNADLLDWYNDGVIILRKVRPDTQIETDGTLIPYAASTDADSDNMLFAEPEVWVIAIADYIAHRGFGEDSGDKRDAERASYHWQEFSNYISML